MESINGLRINKGIKDMYTNHNEHLLSKEIENLSKDKLSFHMPGHKGGRIIDGKIYPYMKSISEIDITEIDGADNLFEPEGIIKKSIKKAEQHYNTKKSYFLVNGTTAGILSMIMASTSPGDKILVQRDCHKSIINGMILGGLTPVYLFPDYTPEGDISLGIGLDQVEEMLNSHTDIVAVVLTYPSYYGLCTDIKSMVDLCHSHGKLVLVDGAHEAHFSLSNRLPLSALDADADIVVHSTHKSLPAFTQSSMLHINSDRVNIDRLEAMLSIHQSSSPSYILMSSLDMAMSIVMKDGHNLMESLLDNIADFKYKVAGLKGVKVLDIELNNSTSIIDKDPTKLLLEIEGLSGMRLASLLKSRGINVELYTQRYVLILLTIGNKDEDFNIAYEAIRDISSENANGNDSLYDEYSNTSIRPTIGLNPKDAFYSQTETISLCDSIGRICGEYITPYPPGIPLVSPGETITEEVYDYILNIRKKGINITGPKDRTLETINVVMEKR